MSAVDLIFIVLLQVAEEEKKVFPLPMGIQSPDFPKLGEKEDTCSGGGGATYYP